MITAIQKGSLYCSVAPVNPSEEYIFSTLTPHIKEDTVTDMFNAVYVSVTQSLSLLKSFDTNLIDQRASLFSSVFNYLCTRVEGNSLTTQCMNGLHSTLEKELLKKHVTLRQERFTPEFIATLLVFYDLCKVNSMEQAFKDVLYDVFKYAGEFPFYVVYALWRHDRNAFVETSLFDTIINNIIGATVTSHRDELTSFHDIVEFYDANGGAWDAKLSEIEASALQCVINSESFSPESRAVYMIAGKSIVLLYIYRGGAYAIQSLIENGLLERIDDATADSEYRLFLVCLICRIGWVDSRVVWCAESGLFGKEWLRIKEVILSLNVITDEMKLDYRSLFAYSV